MYKVIAADDEPIMLRMLEKRVDWAEYGFELSGTAEDGISAFELIENIKPSLAIIDIRMPGLSGVDIARRIKEENIDCAVIIVTAYMDIEYARSCMKYGVKYFLTKPLDRDELCAALEDYKTVFDRGEAMNEIIEQSRVHKRISNPLKRGILAVRGGALGEVSDMVIYEHIPGIVSLLVESNDSLTAEAGKCCRRIFSDDNEAYAVFANRDDYASEEDCYNAALDSLVRLVRPEYGRMYPAEGRGEQKIMSYEFRRYAEKLKQNVEFTNSEAAEEILSEFFSKLSSCRNPLSYAGIFYSYAVIYINRILLENNTPSENLISGARRGVKATLHDYYKALSELCVGAVNALIEAKRNEHLGLSGMAKQYINEHFREPMIIKDIAKMLYTTPGYLGVIFTKNMGVNIREYVNGLRMEEALRLMQETDMGMSEIAYDVGYNNYSYFYVKFEKYFGMTPIQYKKSLKQ